MDQKQIKRAKTTARHRKRKPRTQVSSESSDNDSEPIKNSQGEERKKNKENMRSDFEPLNLCVNNEEKTSQLMTDNEISAAFDEFYLKKVTNEFSDDLDQLRNANDFSEDSVAILISALQQGTSLFSMEEKRRIISADEEVKGDEE